MDKYIKMNASMEEGHIIEVGGEQEELPLVIEDSLLKLKRKLPMLYTERGKMRKSANHERISGKNAAQLAKKADELIRSGEALVVMTPDVNYVLSFNLSADLRESGEIHKLVFAGHDLQPRGNLYRLW